MKSRSTAFWFLLAVALATTIWVLNHFFETPATGARAVLAGLRPNQVTAVQIIPSGGREIAVVRTNKTWYLERPMAYPAQATAVDALLDALAKLTPVTTLSAGEMSGHKNADAEFGFDNPQYTVDVAVGGQTWHLRVGNKTAPGDGVYVRMVGGTGAYVTDPGWLQFLPHEADDWRDTTLVEMPEPLDWVLVTNSTQVIELRRNITNRLWRMVRPLQTRANNLRIVQALEQLRSAKVSRFVNDDPKADLTTYGLEPAALDVWLGFGTNLLTAVHAGKDASGLPGEVYAEREGWNSVVTTPKGPLAAWRGTVNNFRDPNLLELTTPVAEIDVRGSVSFVLEHLTNNWAVAGEKFPVDTDLVNSFIRSVASLPIDDFVQDAVTASSLQAFGLAAPSLEITLRPTARDTNSVLAQLLFGSVSTNGLVYAKRSDEDFVYGVTNSRLNALPLAGDYFRDRQVWNFSETNVAGVTVHQGGKTRQLVREGTNAWALAADSQGIINPLEVEETVHRLGQLTVAGWIGRKFNDAAVGVATNNLAITLTLKSGEQYTMNFGRTDLGETALAVVTLEGQRWAFVFPPTLYPLVTESLTIPPDRPAPAP